MDQKRSSNPNKKICAVDVRKSTVNDTATGPTSAQSSDISPISKLNNDCLREIFRYLSKRELIGIERVCKKWREVALSIWSSVTFLDYSMIKEICDDPHDYSHYMFENLVVEEFKKILSRCGKHLETLNLNDSILHLGRGQLCQVFEIVCAICRYCKNLKHLDLTSATVTNRAFRRLEKDLARNLETLVIKDCKDWNDKVIESFLKQAPNLKKLYMKGCTRVFGWGLINPNKSFKELDISYCRRIKEEALSKILKNSPELEVISVGNVCSFKTLNDCVNTREHLKKIKTQNPQFFENLSAYALPFSSLQSLTLYRVKMSNEILSKFYKLFPNLESLHLDPNYDRYNKNIHSIDNDGLKTLAQLPKLKSLGLSGTDWLQTDTLVYLAANTNGRFETLRCRHCPQLDEELSEFVSLCPGLRELYLTDCKKISDKFLDRVLELMPLRTSQVPLKITCQSLDYFVDDDRYDHSHPLLSVKMKIDNDDDYNDYFKYEDLFMFDRHERYFDEEYEDYE